MKVALLIAGYLRNYEINIDFIKKEIIDKFGIDNVDIFLHITRNENSDDKYFNLINEERDIKNITSVLKPVSTLIENNQFFHDNEAINRTINQWNKLFKLNKLKKINENAAKHKYDLVIRYRPDLLIADTNIFDFKKEQDTIYIPSDSKIDKARLKHKTDKYLCDAFAFGSSRAMDRYFNIHKELPLLIERYGPISETLLYNYLECYNIIYKLVDINYSFVLSKCNVFAICGDSGSGKSTLSNILKNAFDDSFTLELDRYHKWERHNENWKSVTHLNPDANYITKMSEDIFNLKLGKEIFQVDYDHDTGKFTEKQLINPSNNLIVCGLHSLYDKNTSSAYDLKIFMDTDEELKRKWKIKRDTKERGHSLEKVSESIKKRENDFNAYILPQKENADLIVKFFTDDVIDFNNLDIDEDIKLEVLISDKFDINNILQIFNMNNIKYIFDAINYDGFHKIIFPTYTTINRFLDSRLKTNSFYDYILLIIFNLILTN